MPDKPPATKPVTPVSKPASVSSAGKTPTETMTPAIGPNVNGANDQATNAHKLPEPSDSGDNTEG